MSDCPQCSLIIDNTNTNEWEWKPYAVAAKAQGFQVSLVTVSREIEPEVAFERCTHNVPLETIKNQHKNLMIHPRSNLGVETGSVDMS